MTNNFIFRDEDRFVIKIKPEFANILIRWLVEHQNISKEYKIHTQNNFVFIPIKDRTQILRDFEKYDYELVNINKLGFNLPINISKKPNSLKDELQKIIPSDLTDIIPRSFDIVGDFAIIELNREEQQPIRPYIDIIGDKILELHPHIKSVFEKAGDISGVFRTRDLRLIAGENRTETIYKENNCRLKIDILNTFFTPRLSYERARVAALKTTYNTLGMVWDVFCGVGPFIIQIAKHYPDGQYIGTDINPSSIRLAKENQILNKIHANLTFYEIDIQKIKQVEIFNQMKQKISRFIMNLPERNLEFIKFIPDLVHSDGALLHIYQFNKKENALEEAAEKLEIALSHANLSLEKIIFSRTVKPYSPALDTTVIDAIIKKKE